VNRRQRTKLSKQMSYVLRHRPDSVGLELDAGGWVEVEKLLVALGRGGKDVTLAQVQEVVRTGEKQRFSFSDDGLRIRANQGHSVDVELGLEPVEPPELLYHGTVARFLESIRREGIRKGSRHHVHLSPDIETARKVGGRRGRPVILIIEAGRMHAAGLQFFVSANGVWLTEHVPPEYVRFPEKGGNW
jgi:putative RNA 2'-phosphotransferase